MQQPVIEQLHAKPRTRGERGIPKIVASHLDITVDGVVGDYNRYRQEDCGGDPDKAVLLMTAEVLEQLNLEEWPVRPGDLGENILTRGLPYEVLQPGVQLQIGPLTLEVSERSNPCGNLAVLPYVGKERKKEFLQTLRGRRGWYARVLHGGRIESGQPIVVKEELATPLNNDQHSGGQIPC